MKAKKVIKLLQITRPTLCSYVKKGIVKVTELPNGYYEYDDDSVYKLIGVEKRDVVVYSRVSTTSQKSNLDRQIDGLIQFANSRGIQCCKNL